MKRLIVSATFFLIIPCVRSHGDVAVSWFYTDGCHKCGQVEALINRMERKYAGKITIERLEITDLANYKRMMLLDKERGVTRNAPMEVFIEGRHLLGYNEILSGLDGAIADAIARSEKETVETVALIDAARGEEQASAAAAALMFDHIRPLVVAGAGLADGINPCAFATAVFLVSMLASRKFSRPDMIAGGLSFSAAVFVAYFLMGLGAFKAFHELKSFHTLSSIFYWGLVVGLVILGALSLRDAYAYAYRGAGNAGSAALKVSDSSRETMRKFMRRHIKPRFVLAGCFVAGVAVSLLEVVCTGQIYLPAIMVMAQQTSTRSAGIGYLALYNLMFILPLLVVVALSVLGTRFDRFIRFSRGSFPYAKIVLGLFFFGLAALLVILRRSG